MWLYSLTLLTAVACAACSSVQLSTKRRYKQDGNRIASASQRRRYRPSPEDDAEAVQIPMKIPKLTRAQKIALIIESGQNPFEKQRHHGRRRKGKKRSRTSRHVQKWYPGSQYLFADDDDGDIEAQWKEETARKAVWDQQPEHESDTIENGNWESESEANQPTETGHVSKWETTAGMYDGAGYWDTATSPSHWETTSPASWDTVTAWETSPDVDPEISRQEELGEEETATADHDTTTTGTTATAVTTTSDAQSQIWDSPSGTTEEPIWRRLFVLGAPAPSPPVILPLALPIANCPHRFDAVTRAFNGRTYVFARDRVYQLWRQDNLHQKASFFVNEMFPDGPRTVTVAYTNQRSGVTVLIEHQTVYRYRWNRKNKVFYLARKSPQALTDKIPVYPRAGFQWIDGNQVLVEGDNFATYDAYWNVATFTGLTSNYFPQFPRDLIGMTYQNDTLFILYTASNKIQIYDTGKYRVVQEYPIAVDDFVGCSRG